MELTGNHIDAYEIQFGAADATLHKFNNFLDTRQGSRAD